MLNRSVCVATFRVSVVFWCFAPQNNKERIVCDNNSFLFPTVMQISYFKEIKEVEGGEVCMFLFLKVGFDYAAFSPCSAVGCGCTEC